MTEKLEEEIKEEIEEVLEVLEQMEDLETEYEIKGQIIEVKNKVKEIIIK